MFQYFFTLMNINEGLIIALLSILLLLLGFTSIVGFYFDCWVLLRLLGFTSIVGFCVDCWDLFKLWKFCIILVELEKKFWIGKYIAEYTMKCQMIYQWESDNRSVTHFASIVGLMLLIVGLMLLIVGICFKFWKLWISGGYSWVPVGIGGYQWAPVDIGGYWWPLVESKYYIVTNLDCYKLRLLQT